MDRIVAFCGILCSTCPAFIARKENNDELRKKTAAEWSKEFNQSVKPDDVNCDGCFSTTGVLIDYCNTCEIRKCGLERKVENCAYCSEYICAKLKKWFEKAPHAKTVLDEIRENK